MYFRRRSTKPQPSEVYPQYAAIFRRLDSDGSGELSLEEIRTALVKDEEFARMTGAPTTLTRLAATAVAANITDASGDAFGDSESVAINEFVEWLVLCTGQTQAAILERASDARRASAACGSIPEASCSRAGADTAGSRVDKDASRSFVEASRSFVGREAAFLRGGKRADRRATRAADETRWECAAANPPRTTPAALGWLPPRQQPPRGTGWACHPTGRAVRPFGR